MYFVLLFFLISNTSQVLIGGDNIYTTQKGDSFALIGARFALSGSYIAKANGLDPRRPLKPGTTLKFNNLKIVPLVEDIPPLGDYIVINIPDRMLYHFRDGSLRRALPVGLGMLKKDNGRWRTPIRKFKIILKEKNPIWYVPKSIQEEMLREGKEVKTVVPPGPDNPLGRYALHTDIRGILIHETIAPTSVYGFKSHGCIRVLDRDMEDFFNEIEKSTPGQIIYKPIKVAKTPSNRVFLEVYPDFYRTIKDLEGYTKRLLEEAGLLEEVDWQKVSTMLKEKKGVAEDITR